MTVDAQAKYDEIIKMADEVWEKLRASGDFRLLREWIELMNEAIIIKNISDYSDE